MCVYRPCGRLLVDKCMEAGGQLLQVSLRTAHCPLEARLHVCNKSAVILSCVPLRFCALEQRGDFGAEHSRCFGQCLTLMVAVLQKDTLATHEALTSDTVEPVDIGRVVRALQRGQHWCLLPSLGHRHHLMPAVPMIRD